MTGLEVQVRWRGTIALLLDFSHTDTPAAREEQEHDTAEALPAAVTTAEENDALARQTIIAMGLQLADHSLASQGHGTGVNGSGDGQGVEGQRGGVKSRRKWRRSGASAEKSGESGGRSEDQAGRRGVEIWSLMRT